MKTKTKFKYLAVGFFIVALLMLVIGVSLLGGIGETQTASAVTITKYTMTFAYTHYYHYNSSTSVRSSANATTEATVQANSANNTTVKIYMYGSAPSGDATVPIGGGMREKSPSIVLEGDWLGKSITVTNSVGAEIGSSSSGSLALSTLSDDTYTITCEMQGAGWTSNRAYAWYSMTATTSFAVDTKNPIVNGASTSQTGKFVNSEFTVSASDSGSGVENLYMKEPNGNSFVAVGTSRTITASSVNGLYSFYAKDNAGNSSGINYVYYDSSSPTVTVKNSSGATVSDEYINTAFSCLASDIGSGVSYIEYTTPSQTSWTTYTESTQIAESSPDGLYQFRAVDKAGNVSEIKKVIKDTTNPSGKIYGENTEVISGGKTKASYIKFEALDATSGVDKIYVKKPNTSSFASYTFGTQFITNGTYSFYCTDKAGNTSATFTVSLDNVAPVLTCSQTAFYEMTEYDFTVKATDVISSCTLYYKTPLMTEYKAASGGSYSVVTTDSDGRYYFYAEDAVGNCSETKWIELKVAVPTATVEQDSSTNRYRITWDGSSTGRLNDKPYAKGTWISTEGEYTFVITNSSNRANTYRFTIAHSFVVVKTVKPTCTEKGYTVYKCLTCDSSYNSDYVAQSGHNYAQQLIGENCNEGSYYLYTCSVCNYQYKSEYLTTGGHKLDKTVVKATCIERGYTINKCTVCEHTYRDDYTAALGHNFNVKVVEPTCLDGGYSTYECKRCDYEYVSDYTAPNGHNYEVTVVEATCTEKGYKQHKCLNCSDKYVTDETFAIGHYYTERTQDVSCIQDGCIIHTCTRCGYEYATDVTKALGHKHVSEVTMTATCVDDGNRHHICERCGDQYDTAITAFGHNYEIADVQTDGGVTVRTYSCSVCGYSYTQDLGDQYEEVSNYVEYLFNQYKPYMWWVLLAVSGVWSIAMGIAIIVAHKNEDKHKAKKMLVNYLIGLVVIAVILVACPYLVKGIASLVAA